MSQMVISKNIEKNEYGDQLIMDVLEGTAAPADGSYYVMQDGAWIKLEDALTSLGIEVPNK